MAERARSAPLPASPPMPVAGRREDVLRELRSASEPQTISSLAGMLQLHPNTVRFHLDSLIAAGRVRRADRGPRRPGRPASLYEAVRGMDPGGPRSYQTLAEILTVAVAARTDAQALALDASRRWGRARARGRTRGAIPDRLMGLLEELGFAPERRDCDGGQQIGLRHCPFLELAESHAPVTCSIHLGLMQGAMQEWDADRTVGRLEPFVEPDLCVAHLSAID